MLGVWSDLSEGADGVGIDNCAEIKEFPLSGVTSSGRVWRKVPKMMLGVYSYVPPLSLFLFMSGLSFKTALL